MTKRHLFVFSLFIVFIGFASSAWASSLRDVIATLETPFQAGTAEKYRRYPLVS